MIKRSLETLNLTSTLGQFKALERSLGRLKTQASIVTDSGVSV